MVGRLVKQSALDFTAPAYFDPQSLAVAPSKDLAARETSALAAMENAASGRKATQNARILALLTAAGAHGLSHIELHRLTGYPRASICARMGFDLRPLVESCGRHQDAATGSTFTRWRIKTDGDAPGRGQTGAVDGI